MVVWIKVAPGNCRVTPGNCRVALEDYRVVSENAEDTAQKCLEIGPG